MLLAWAVNFIQVRGFVAFDVMVSLTHHHRNRTMFAMLTAFGVGPTVV